MFLALSIERSLLESLIDVLFVLDDESERVALASAQSGYKNIIPSDINTCAKFARYFNRLLI